MEMHFGTLDISTLGSMSEVHPITESDGTSEKDSGAWANEI